VILAFLLHEKQENPLTQDGMWPVTFAVAPQVVSPAAAKRDRDFDRLGQSGELFGGFLVVLSDRHEGGSHPKLRNRIRRPDTPPYDAAFAIGMWNG